MRPASVGAARALSIAALASACAACGGGGSSSATSATTQTNSNIVVTVSPLIAQVAPNGTQLYTASVTGTSNTAVTWSVANSTMGSIDASGLYTAPTTAPVPSNVTITATSVADTTKAGTGIADIHVHHDTQDIQTAPVRLGTSGGNKSDTTQSGTKLFCCSGTLGSLVSRGGNFYILSNNHVLDRSDQGTIGDPISQPGLVDTQCGRTTNNIVANLSQAVPLHNQTVDAALAQIVTGEVDLSGTVLDLAAPGQPAAPSSTLATATLGQGVAKSGEATGLTCAPITAVNVSVTVNYSTSCQGGTTFPITFNNQIAIGSGTFSNSGDSGSLVVTSDNARPVGLLYAGNTNATIANPIQDVLSALSDSTGTPAMVGGPDHPVSCPATNQSAVAAREKRGVVTTLPDSEVARATTVKNRRTIELMQDPTVSGVGVGQSEDNAAESAIVVFLNGQLRTPIPAQLDGVRTKVIAGSAFLPQGAGTQQISVLPGISQTEIVRARTVKEQHAQELMSNSAILGVGVGASNDNPTEGALVIFVDKSSSAAIPGEIDGVRTRVILSDPFRSYNWGTRTVKACSRR